MARLVNRDFKYKGRKFHLNDNYRHNEFEGRYVLLFWHCGWKRWQSITTVDSKKEAKELLRQGVI